MNDNTRVFNMDCVEGLNGFPTKYFDLAIVDPPFGLADSRIAAMEMGFDFTGYEKDKNHFENQEKRFGNYKAQLKLFTV